MKCRTLFCVALSLLVWRSVGQVPLPKSYLSYAVQISERRSDVRGEPMGSGFLLQASNSVYLVTARHVLFELRGTNGWRLKRSKVEVAGFVSEQITNYESTTFVLDLDALSADGNVRHSTNRDIALVRFESCNPENKAIVKFLPGAFVTNRIMPVLEKLLVKTLDASSVGADIFLFGFPASIGVAGAPQLDSALPLMRKGIIAGMNPSRGTMVLDCPVYQGNSGGPVVMRQQTSITRWEFHLVGIAVEWVPFQDVWESRRFRYTNQTISNSGYSIMESVSGGAKVA